MPIEFVPLHPLFAAEARGVDLAALRDPGALAEIRAAMHRFAVLVFRDQRLDDRSQVEFAGRLDGQLHSKTGISALAANRFGNEALTDVSNVDENGQVLPPDDRRRHYSLANRLWHTDASFVDPPGRYSMLSARIVPPVGADTEFADMRAAWDALDARTRRQVEGLVCLHSQVHSRAKAGFDELSDAERVAFRPVRHRLVRTHPSTGRKSLFLSSHAGEIEGMSLPEARMLLLDLTEFATQPRFVYSHAWRLHDLLMWDNQATMHRGRPFDPAEPRDIRQTRLRCAEGTIEQHA